MARGLNLVLHSTILSLDTSRLRAVQARSKYIRVFSKYKDLSDLQGYKI